MKNSNGSIGNRTRDLPACSEMPLTTAPPRIPVTLLISEKAIIPKCKVVHGYWHLEEASSLHVQGLSRAGSQKRR